ncbi:DUF726 domain protein [Aspergillus sp. HF37]|nr:DUF726 domain protein [Aspergillus sp. HF37]
MIAGSSAAGDRAVVSTECSQRPPQSAAEHDVGHGKENQNPGDLPDHAGEEGQNDEVDDFGLPIRVRTRPMRRTSESSEEQEVFHDIAERGGSPGGGPTSKELDGERTFQDAASVNQPEGGKRPVAREYEKRSEGLGKDGQENGHERRVDEFPSQNNTNRPPSRDEPTASKFASPESLNEKSHAPAEDSSVKDRSTAHASHTGQKSIRPSEFSHQRLTEERNSEDDESDGDEGWRNMPALDEFDIYDDFGRIVARGATEVDNDEAHNDLGGAGKGYTRVQLDDDAQSATSLDEDTSYLFKEAASNSIGVEDDEMRDPVSQLQATKDILTEGQRIAYVGVTRLAIHQMMAEFQKIPSTKDTRKVLQKGMDAMLKWSQSIMARLYSHMDINSAEQTMIEQLAEHGVEPADLVPPLMENARVKNPVAEETDSPRKSQQSTASRDPKDEKRAGISNDTDANSPSTPPPLYEAHAEDIPEVQSPSQLPDSDKIDIDLRWTVLCDLFLVLIADTAYDSRSRTLLELVGKAMEVSWLQISRFEKRVIDALEMQEAADKETWDGGEHMEKRRKMALKRKYMVMGLATVGGGLVIGLTGGLLGPVIGAGLAAGFTTVGVGGTGGFLGGAGGTALIASGATLTGSTIGLKASHRRTGAVQTFEYRPLHNNKRLNLIVTVGGWMTGKLDDIRLPYSTVDPIMGDLYSVLWEPEMLRSMGDTINILATEALAQGLQQALGSTILVALMASLQLPLVLTKLSYLIDNPWNVSLARANAAGLILADSLIENNLGKRPVTLLGFSLGSRVIFSCLKELAEKGAHGLVQNVYLFGSPVVGNKEEYLKARSVVSNRFVNGYSSNDWILGYLFRATSGGIMRVAGLAPVEEIPGLENFDVTKLVNGHMDYRTAMPRLLKEVGWEVLSEEFAEIEDPDPDNHAERQRELIREIDGARREAELKPERRRFGIFKRGKLTKKKGWETYDVERNATESRTSSESNGGSGSSVLFDIDAIKAELASEMIEVRQLESTLPPMKVDLNSSASTLSPAEPSPLYTSDTKDSEPSLTGPEVPPGSAPFSHQDPHSPAGDDEEVKLTFDTSFHDSPRRSHSFEPTRSETDDPATAPANVGTSAVGAMALEPNAWADHDIGHGEEGEMHMSFE